MFQKSRKINLMETKKEKKTPITKRKKNSGGKRGNCGRKKATDPKQDVWLYVETSKIDKLGGMEKVKGICLDHIEKSVNSLPPLKANE